MEHCGNTNDTSLKNCYSHGRCTPLAPPAPNISVCFCKRGYNLKTNCATLSSDELFPSNASLYAITMIIQSIFFLITFAEIVVDLKLDRRVSWRKPALIAKFVLLFTFLVGITFFAMQLDEIFQRRMLSDIALSLLVALNSILLSACLGLVTVGWISVVMKVKALGRSIHIKRYRIFVFVLFCLTMPFVLLTSFLFNFGVIYIQIYYTYVAVLSIYTFVVILGTTVPIIQTIMWSCRKKGENDTMRRVGLKTIWLLIVNIALAIFYIQFIIQATGAAGFGVTMGSLAGNAVTMLVAQVSYILFLENYMFRFGFLKGYILGLRGELEASAATVVKTATKGSRMTATKATELSMPISSIAPKSSGTTTTTIEYTREQSSSTTSSSSPQARSDGVDSDVSDAGSAS